MSGSAGTDMMSIALGFIVLMLVLVEMHGFSSASAIFAIPVVLFSGILLFLSHLLGLFVGFFIGALAAGPIALLILAVAIMWASRALVGVTAQNYMLFAVFIILMLLVV